MFRCCCWPQFKVRLVAKLLLILAVMYITKESLQHLSLSIVTVSREHVSNNSVARSFSRKVPHCTGERRNFAFIKCMKCATETMGTVLRRFGYVRHLNFVLPRKRNLYLGWPFPMEKSDYRPSMKPYNVLLEHSVYNHSIMSAILPADTAYITIIREPWSHFKSVFHYFKLAKTIGIQGADPIGEYLNNVNEYDRIFTSPEKASVGIRWCIPNNFSLTRNLMSHCMGMPLGFPSGRYNIVNNTKAIQEYIDHLNGQFTLVMIFEYFHESLVLLKRLMCWSFKDIVFHLSNVGQYEFKGLMANESTRVIHRNWSRIDYVLYEHFNRTFWNKVHAQGASFLDEVEQFTLVQMLISRFCFVEGNWNTKDQTLNVPKSKFSAAFNVTSSDCKLMNMYMLPLIWERYDHEEPSNFTALNVRDKNVKPVKGCSIN